MAISSYGVRAETAPDGSEASATGLARLLIDRGEAERLAAVLKAIADPTRLQLLRLIERAPRGEACVCDLTDCLGLRQPTVSHHLKVMTESGLLNRERRGTWVWYSVDPAGLRRVREVLEPVSPQEPVAV
ncbi:metalloregulator ArsR/SmtB family transcription factor [Streptomyces hirsutus]|uniref:Metalloregulator ArsR/SmtB family transcription factor n=1 Tax=Streptomyces hirsutus TaxID=35620 RepID=A0ABZ1GHV0_9ACTN|nr:metalloregulator ArsR/SmtB family transcription factor [Streptomyces hirsutus]WSD04862.1 metalloregulator ArsR/SmtB family transcription factor [Streptomyces hirsutus]WTD21746.1 metalloregulator ArsR/SmtB family transcription factor [Streptomyces hirsutus]WTD73453.1 metalloregulator ArsR/SmtB family transcription factor [Streptomyces sp. NBC_01635]